MSKDSWLAAYERVYDEHADDDGITEEQMATLTDELAAKIEARKIDAARERLKEETQ